jgi:L-iditol 2-dehydrogenase
MTHIRALRLHPGGALRIHREPAPVPGPGEALVRVGSVGLCGSDRHWALEGGIGDAVLDRPLVLGHELGGVAVDGRLRDRLVAVDPSVSCERCEPCRHGRQHLCLDVRFAGHGHTDGGLRELVAWPERSLHPLPDGSSADEAALVEPLSVAVHAVGLAGSLDGAAVGVVGSGPIGLLLVAVACRSGARAIVATDPLPHRLAAAAGLGATSAIEATPAGDERAQIRSVTGGRGLDVVFDAAGDPAAIETAVDVAAPGGTVVLVGIPADDRTAFRASWARRKELALRVSRRSSHSAFRRAVELVERREVDVRGLVTMRVPLDEAAKGFDALVARSEIKVVVEPGAVGPTGAGPGEPS